MTKSFFFFNQIRGRSRGLVPTASSFFDTGNTRESVVESSREFSADYVQ